jgi:hypothetical protein
MKTNEEVLEFMREMEVEWSRDYVGGFPAIVEIVGQHVVVAGTEHDSNEPTLEVYDLKLCRDAVDGVRKIEDLPMRELFDESMAQLKEREAVAPF